MDNSPPSAFPRPQIFNGKSLGFFEVPKMFLDDDEPDILSKPDTETSTKDFTDSNQDEKNPWSSTFSPFYSFDNNEPEEEEVNEDGPYENGFPTAKDYESKESIIKAFPHLKGHNNPEFDVNAISSNAHFYVMRSSNDDNIHKGIKYHVWTSTVSGKRVLRKAWLEFEERGEKPEIYLIFTVVSTNQFMGVAKMMSNVNDSESFKYWWEPCKWFGQIQLKWIFIKDVHHGKFAEIRDEYTNTPIISLNDGTKISAENGRKILTIFLNHPSHENIFEYFEFMDQREDQLRSLRDNDFQFNLSFQECCKKYQQSPETIIDCKKNFNQKQLGGFFKRYSNQGPYHRNQYQYQNQGCYYQPYYNNGQYGGNQDGYNYYQTNDSQSPPGLHFYQGNYHPQQNGGGITNYYDYDNSGYNGNINNNQQGFNKQNGGHHHHHHQKSSNKYNNNGTYSKGGGHFNKKKNGQKKNENDNGYGYEQIFVKVGDSGQGRWKGKKKQY